MFGKTLTGTTKIKLLLDVAISLAVLASLSPAMTGPAIHEWLGMAVAVPLVVHLLLNWKWIAATTRRFFGALPGQVRINYVLNAALFITMTATIFSGMMMSEVALRSLGLSLGHSPSMRMVHSLSTTALVWVVGLHLAMHWNWVACAVRRYVIDPLRGRSGADRATAALSAVPAATTEQYR
jgi:cytochrome b